MQLDKDDQIILIGLSLLIMSMNVGSSVTKQSDTSYGNNPEYKSISTTNLSPTVDTNPIPNVVPTIVPKSIPDAILDIDIDTKALLYQKGDCTILIKDYTEIGNKDAEVGNCTYNNWEDFKKRLPKLKPTVVPTVEPTIVPTIVPQVTEVPKREWTISEIDNIFEGLSRKGWQSQLYELNEFDCSKMSSYWQMAFEKDGITSYIVESHSRSHAWVAVRVSDLGEKSTKWTIWTDSYGVEWYYIESTVPKVVSYDDIPFYNVKDAKIVGTYDQAVQYSRKEYELTTNDIQKVNNFLNE